MDISTARLILHPITPDEAGRIVDGSGRPDGAWHPSYPFDDELVPLGSLATQIFGEPIFTLYQIRELETGLAVGGIGFFGPPDADGTVEFGYGLIAEARGQGYASEAARAFVTIAERNGAAAIIADTTVDNLASQRVLTNAGLRETHRSAGTAYFRRSLTS